MTLTNGERIKSNTTGKSYRVIFVGERMIGLEDESLSAKTVISLDEFLADYYMEAQAGESSRGHTLPD